MADLTALKQADMENWLRKRHKTSPRGVSKAQRGDLEAAFLLMMADSANEVSRQRIHRALMVQFPNTQRLAFVGVALFKLLLSTGVSVLVERVLLHLINE